MQLEVRRIEMRIIFFLQLLTACMYIKVDDKSRKTLLYEIKRTFLEFSLKKQEVGPIF